MKYKVISAAMVIAPLFLSTGFATTVQACPSKAPVAVHKVVRKAAPKPVRKTVVKPINKSKHKVAPKVGHKAAPKPITQVQHR
ncbi:hypothetical protein LN736_17020 [Clostridium sp. WLY-B-L2]|uniref:Uncharacterized protein n=2 Tax=Clostridium TaxID=1485 RepID=A0ABS8N9R5_9CLOT|nr:hypothetical protein [Clostridium aromativorans]MCC9296548.1 hypothetical protein [Clostridium aromativorans]